MSLFLFYAFPVLSCLKCRIWWFSTEVNCRVFLQIINLHWFNSNFPFGFHPQFSSQQGFSFIWKAVVTPSILVEGSHPQFWQSTPHFRLVGCCCSHSFMIGGHFRCKILLAWGRSRNLIMVLNMTSCSPIYVYIYYLFEMTLFLRIL